MKFRVVIAYDEVAKAYSAVCPELPGCASAGDTVLEAKLNIREAIELYLQPADIEIPANATLDEVTIG
ncbi:MAG: type II toxin-antitoxin system HicB family antitoxin [Acidobacteria bacterium]|nr:type II toxin-antitoxin system HicB family antitoxin [Acidobacteriota bacterium]